MLEKHAYEDMWRFIKMDILTFPTMKSLEK